MVNDEQELELDNKDQVELDNKDPNNPKIDVDVDSREVEQYSKVYDNLNLSSAMPDFVEVSLFDDKELDEAFEMFDVIQRGSLTNSQVLIILQLFNKARNDVDITLLDVEEAFGELALGKLTVTREIFKNIVKLIQERKNLERKEKYNVAKIQKRQNDEELDNNKLSKRDLFREKLAKLGNTKKSDSVKTRSLPFTFFFLVGWPVMTLLYARPSRLRKFKENGEYTMSEGIMKQILTIWGLPYKTRMKIIHKTWAFSLFWFITVALQLLAVLCFVSGIDIANRIGTIAYITGIEATAPLLMYIFASFIIALLINVNVSSSTKSVDLFATLKFKKYTSKDLRVLSKISKDDEKQLNLEAKNEENDDENNDIIDDSVSSGLHVLAYMFSASDKELKGLKRQNTFKNVLMVVGGLLFATIPFLVRANLGYPLLGGCDSAANVATGEERYQTQDEYNACAPLKTLVILMTVSGFILNGIGIAFFLKLLGATGAIFVERLLLMKRVRSLIKSQKSAKSKGVPFMSLSTPDNVRLWGEIRNVVSNFKALAFRRIEIVLGVLVLLLILFVVPFIAIMEFGSGLRSELNGTVGFVYAGCALALVGLYLIFPTLTYGVRINAVNDTLQNEISKQKWDLKVRRERMRTCFLAKADLDDSVIKNEIDLRLGHITAIDIQDTDVAVDLLDAIKVYMTEIDTSVKLFGVAINTGLVSSIGTVIAGALGTFISSLGGEEEAIKTIATAAPGAF